ncbi:hypothetical protein JR316_0012992 [Psilocybe cubensis]|uniref:Uncharacterized protein n=1 Tax=Psilocybe cubensis TaxID=181762 RepID=A0ACB8GFW0_PSICU|nr:hypothetical protein JR316_0012992 [Psilocybe cubensis]KAH9474531.1 hypothetical protein JR316_0012992 [Psilocybe cubensis]
MPLKLLTTLYGLVILFALGETALGWWAGFTNGWSHHLRLFGRFAGVISLCAWIWVGILLSYHNRPGSTHPLTQTFVHLHTFTMLTGLYLALGIAIASQVPAECGEGYSDGLSGMWCGVSASACAVAFLLGVLCQSDSVLFADGIKANTSLVAGITLITIRLASPSMKENVCSGDRGRPVGNHNDLITIT